jgi:hypothetical protein
MPSARTGAAPRGVQPRFAEQAAQRLREPLIGHDQPLPVSLSAWHHKQRPTFADTLAAARCAIWNEQGFVTSGPSVETAKLPPALRKGIAYTLCHAA